MRPRDKSRTIPRRRLWGWLVVAFVLGCLTPTAHRHARAALLLADLGGGAPDWAAGLQHEITEESMTLADGVRARLYRPESTGSLRGVVFAHGVHRLGIDEPRLVALARAFARAGMVVLTPELAPLAAYRIEDPANLRALELAVEHLSGNEALGTARRVGLAGVSFAGGLSLRLAAEPRLADRLAFVASIGGHHDLARVARFFVTDRVEAPEGEIEWKAHDYGLAVLVHGAPERFVPAEQAEPLRTAVNHFLGERYEEAEQAAATLDEPARTIYGHVHRRERTELAPQVLSNLEAMKPLMDAASPRGRISEIRAPIFLLHGAADTVIPPSESRWVAHEAGPEQAIELLLSEQLGHAELNGEDAFEESVRLVRFLAAMLGS